MQSGQIWAAGVEDISKQVSAMAPWMRQCRRSALTTAKSVKQAMDFQTNAARSTVVKTLNESSKITNVSFG